MGGADVVPGVSGGTVALVLGIYSRLVGAISRFDAKLVQLALSRKLSQAWEYADLSFLITLGTGIVIGIVSLGEISNRLLTTSATSRSATLAFFFGMIAASTFVVGRRIEPSQRAYVPLLLGVAGATFAFWITGLPTATKELTLPYVFACGSIAISAMILPGISGAYLLLVLGLYLPLTDILKRLRHLDVNGFDLTVVVVFGLGCGIGIVLFSKFLKWLLARHHSATMAVLAGFMVGALRKIWPFQTPIHEGGLHAKHQEYANYLPSSINSTVLLCAALVVIGFGLVMALHRFGPADDAPTQAGAA